jgi:hypothetical protein
MRLTQNIEKMNLNRNTFWHLLDVLPFLGLSKGNKVQGVLCTGTPMFFLRKNDFTSSGVILFI